MITEIAYMYLVFDLIQFNNTKFLYVKLYIFERIESLEAK